MCRVNGHPVEVGAIAPEFELQDQHGSPVRLSQFRGTPVVLVFYPLAFSGVCQGELSALRGFTADAQLLTVSVDSVFVHRAWAEQEGYALDRKSTRLNSSHVKI